MSGAVCHGGAGARQRSAELATSGNNRGENQEIRNRKKIGRILGMIDLGLPLSIAWHEVTNLCNLYSIYNNIYYRIGGIFRGDLIIAVFTVVL